VVPDSRVVLESRQLVDATRLSAADAVLGAALRAHLELHLARDPGNSVVIWPPTSPEVWRRLNDLLGPLPDRCEFAADAQRPERDPSVLVPAQPVPNSEIARLLARALIYTARGGGLPLSLSRRVGGALVELVQNSMVHASDSPLNPVVSVAVESDPSEAILAVIDLGRSVADAEDPVTALHRRVDDSVRALRTFGWLSRLWSARLEIASGTGRVAVTELGISMDEGAFVPGFAAVSRFRL
jgi:anti-sigma regulatory factor (Ser/Thr protein kinase)